MLESHERTLPRIVNAPLGWLRGRWNEALYGFPQGHARRIQTEALLKQDRLNLHGVQQLLHLMGETHNSRLQLSMAQKVRISVDQLVDAQRLPQMDMQGLSDYVDRVAREEGLE